MQHRGEVALAAFKSGQDPAGVQCPNCGGYRMQAMRIDADATLGLGVVSLIVGLGALLLALVIGDAGLYVANTSVVAVALLIIGVVLLLVARRRRKPSAFECFACGYRVP